MKLLVYSDIHLERQQFVPGHAADAADVVVLAGDIGEGLQGMEWARRTFTDKPIVMVHGNHEFFGGNDFFKLLDQSYVAARKLDINFLECDSVAIDGVRFLGATLWTDFRLFSHSPADVLRRMDETQRTAKDYLPGNIRVTMPFGPPSEDAVHLLPAHTVQRHADSLLWLGLKLPKGDPAKTVVVTHHCPHINSIPPQFRSGALSQLTPAYASDLSHLGGQCALWIHGHVHESVDFDMNGTRVVSNPMGYHSAELGPQNPRFTDLLIEV